METRRYYELKDRYVLINKELYTNLKKRETLKEKIVLTEEEIDILNAMNGTYKQYCCRIRASNNIKHVLALIPYLNEKGEMGAEVILFDYKLPSSQWNSWLKISYDEDKELLYVEI